MEFLRLEIRRGHLPARRVGVGRGRLLVMAVDLRAYLERASRVEAD
jgi:hypothetical protein